jgi:competence ComEA-like helix-hairpin-helix protein
MKDLWKDILYFSREEKRGVIAIVAITLLCGLIIMLIGHTDTADDTDDGSFGEEYEAFMVSLQQKKQRGRHSGLKYAERALDLHPFNPNTADSAEFVSMGLPQWMAHNILSYRSKGGHFRKAEDFAKIYGLTEDMFSQIEPYIVIPDEPEEARVSLLVRDSTRRDSIFKYPRGTVLPINAADTTELKKIPGVGSGIARMIVYYRDKLGGFYSVEQLSEINLRADSLRLWLTTLPTDTMRTVNVNRSSVARMRSHPYINFYQARAIAEHRRKYGNLHSLDELRLMEEFTESDMQRLKHYVSF